MSLIKFSDFRPTQFDCKGLGSEGQEDWLVAEPGVSRDSGAMGRSNWRVLNKCLDEIDPDGNDHEIHRFNHWGPGWFEIVVVRPDTACAKEAQRISDALTDYPVIDDDDYSREEAEESEDIWKHWSIEDRVTHIQQFNKKYCESISIFAARRDEVPSGMFSYMRDA